MNKIYIFIVLFAIVLGGCQIGDEKTNIHKQNSNEFLEESTSILEDESEDSRSAINNLVNESPKNDLQNSNNTIFKSDNLGFCLSFPKEWSEYYKIFEDENGIEVNFYGKSLAGQGAPHFPDKGLNLFCIISENYAKTETWDLGEKVGIAKGITYYYATSTGSQLAPIIMTDEELNIYTKLYGEDLYGEPQINIIFEDRQIVEKMLKDIPSIINSFKEIPTKSH